MTTQKFIINHIVVVLGAIALLFAGSLAYASPGDGEHPVRAKALQKAKQIKARAVGATDGVACTADAKVCPDGTSVGRVGPKCEFARCPGTERKDKARNVFKRLKTERDDQVADWQRKKDTVRGETRELREHVKERRGEVRDTVKEKRAEVKEALDAAETPEERQAILEEARAKKAEFKEKIKAERKELREKVKGRISEHVQQVIKRLDAMHDRLAQINTRIQSHLDKLVERGVDTSGAQSYLDTAKAAVSGAGDSVRAAKALIEEAVSAENPAEYRESVRAAMRAAIAGVKDAKKAIQEAVRAAKNLATQ